MPGGYWKSARHLEYLNGKLVDLTTRSIYRLLISMPPRHGKTELVARIFIAWYLINFPHHRAIYVTSTAAFARRYGNMVRALIEEYGPRYGVFVSQERGSVSDFELVDAEGKPTGGGMLSVGFGSRLVGRGADLMVIDDLLSGEDSQSELKREKAWNFWLSDAATRLQPRNNELGLPGGVAIEIQTRHHEDDLAGRLESAMHAGGERWEIVRFPAIAEESDILGRQPGEALWPEMFPLTDPAHPEREDVLEKIKIRSGPYWWSAEYQQHPTPLEGAFFKKTDWRYFKVAKHIDPAATLRDGPYVLMHGDREELVAAKQGTVIMTVDLATSEKTVADYTVWLVGKVLTDGRILVLEVARDHLAGPELPDATVALWQKWQADELAVEKKGFQLAIIQGIWRLNVPVRELDVKGDKVGRALPMSARVAAHQVFLLQGAPWLPDFVDEHAVFPRGTHDDQVDADAYLGLEAERVGLGNAWVQLSADQAEQITQQTKKGLL